MDTMSLIIGYYEIDRFKNLKTESYYVSISRLIKVENGNIINVNNLWDIVLDHERLKKINCEIKLVND